MLAPVTLPDLFSAISSPDLAVGVTPCASPDGPTTDLFGRAVAHANLSAPPALKKAPLMIDTSGLSGSISSASAALALSLVSKLKQRSATAGSTLFKLTWKESNYAVAAAGIPAAGFGAPHIRQRLWFVAESDQCSPNSLRGQGPRSHRSARPWVAGSGSLGRG
jgi:hypothetical protein